MKNYYLIGLGGSGGKIITELYKRIEAEEAKKREEDLDVRGVESLKDHVTSIAIDTDQDELSDLGSLGVKQVCISGSGNVGELYNRLGEDVGEWCPNTSNEGVFFASEVYNGASQCRLKSRLCLANFLKDPKNSLKRILDDSQTIKATGGAALNSPPIVLIASSIAGGTGSGIFIQVALYIKKYFRNLGVNNVKIHGLFACPDLYVDVVPAQQHQALYSNAYAVVRELNALNLISGAINKAADGQKIDIDMEISTECEGKLFEKDAEGRYGEKPYDIMYFVDKVNYLKHILGGLPEYYKAMANIAYSHLYTDISGDIQSNESNEMKAHIPFPSAIYGCAGAATMEYPYYDIVRYFSNRSIMESFNGVWTALDDRWKNYYSEKDATARAMGMAKYVPKAGERAERYIEDFEALVKTLGVSQNQYSFMAPMIERDGISAVDKLLSVIDEKAANLVRDDKRISAEKSSRSIDNIQDSWNSMVSAIDNSTANSEGRESIFVEIQDIDDNLDQYCRQCIKYVADMSISFANEIFAEDKILWNYYDAKSDCSIISGLMIKDGKWIHPVAARYLLYSFRKRVGERISELFSQINTPSNDVDDYYNYLFKTVVTKQKNALKNSAEDGNITNAAILKRRFDKFLGKKATKAGLKKYFEMLIKVVESADIVFAEALQYFALAKVNERINNLIAQYEMFFDNLDEFIKNAATATSSYETMHDNSRGIVYVCASAEVKNKMYDDVGRNIDTQTGDIASAISKGLFDSLRERSAEKGNATKSKKLSMRERSRGIESFFNRVSDLVFNSAKDNTDITGAIDKNVFKAILYEYSLLNPQYSSDRENFNTSSEAHERLSRFISEKIALLAQMSAPLLVYDQKDPYSGMLNYVDENNKKVEKNSVTNFYRYVSHHSKVEDSIRELLGATNGSSGIVSTFYGDKSSLLPKDTNDNSVYLQYKKSDGVDQYSILCYSVVHCLQPYQIQKFDELAGGEYFENYAKTINEMESLQNYSMTPHLDKRWHKHGAMPYINLSKEMDRRYDLGEAFVYALGFGKIGYFKNGGETKCVYQDMNLGKAPARIIYKGSSIPYSKINRAMYWFAEQESLIELYSSLYESLVAEEIQMLSKYSDNVGNYKRGITKESEILEQLKTEMIRAIRVGTTRSGRTVELEKETPMGLLEFAWVLHKAEESEFDKDYGELLVEMLCETIKRYARAPYNAEDIKNKNEGTSAYGDYCDVRDHVKMKFMIALANTIGIEIKEEEFDEAQYDKEAENATGRKALSDEHVVRIRTGNIELDYAIENNPKLRWANALMNRYLAD